MRLILETWRYIKIFAKWWRQQKFVAFLTSKHGLNWNTFLYLSTNLNHESESFKYLIWIKFDFHENTYELTSSFVLLIPFVMEPLVKGQWCTVIPMKHIQYIPRNVHTVFALLCFVVVIHWLIFPYPSGLLHWHCGNLTIAPVPAKQPWWIWINTSCEFIMNDCITTTKQSTTKPCAYFLECTVGVNTTLQNTPASLNVVTPRHGNNFVINPNRLVIKQSNCRGFEKPRRSCYFTVIT